MRLLFHLHPAMHSRYTAPTAKYSLPDLAFAAVGGQHGAWVRLRESLVALVSPDRVAWTEHFKHTGSDQVLQHIGDSVIAAEASANRTSSSLIGYDAITGKRSWIRPWSHRLRGPDVTVFNGRLACVSTYKKDRYRLELLSPIDGATVDSLELPEEPLGLLPFDDTLWFWSRRGTGRIVEGTPFYVDSCHPYALHRAGQWIILEWRTPDNNLALATLNSTSGEQVAIDTDNRWPEDARLLHSSDEQLFVGTTDGTLTALQLPSLEPAWQHTFDSSSSDNPPEVFQALPFGTHTIVLLDGALKSELRILDANGQQDDSLTALFTVDWQIEMIFALDDAIGLAGMKQFVIIPQSSQ